MKASCFTIQSVVLNTNIGAYTNTTNGTRLSIPLCLIIGEREREREKERENGHKTRERITNYVVYLLTDVIC